MWVDEYRRIKKFISDNSIAFLVREDGIRLGNAYITIHQKNYFKAWDKRDGLIRYLINHGFNKARYQEVCRCCGQDNCRRYVTSECPTLEELRIWTELIRQIHKER
jgi:hypothetical protein